MACTQKTSTPQQTPTTPAVLGDGVGAQYMRVDNMHQVRYIEIFLAGRDPVTGNIVAACYNPMFTTAGIPASRDTAPQALVEGLDFEQMKKEYGLLGASLNGPKLWLPDWSEIDAGKVRDFNGMRAAWVAQLNMGDKTSIAESEPYTPATIARKSGVGWNKGTTVLLLDDAEGNTWVMKGFQLGLEPLCDGALPNVRRSQRSRGYAEGSRPSGCDQGRASRSGQTRVTRLGHGVPGKNS